MDKLADATAAYIRLKISKLEIAKLGPEYSYHSLPLCVIDSVFSIGVRYANAQKAVESWCSAQTPPWTKFHTENEPRKKISDLVTTADGKDGNALSDQYFGGNKQRTSSRGGILKAEAVVLFARALQSAFVEDFEDIRDPDRESKARESVRAVTGHASGISFDYLMMLAGDDSFVKADRMICRFVAHASGKSAITPEEARKALIGSCQLLSTEYPNLTPRLLDHLIWQHQRKLQRTPLVPDLGT